MPNAIRVFKEMKEKDPNFHGYGIRIDSGDLAYLSKKAYEMLELLDSAMRSSPLPVTWMNT